MSPSCYSQEEWIKRSGKGGTDASPNQRPRGGYDYRNKEGGRGVRDKSRIRCFNCITYGHFASECRKLKREREKNPEVNLTQIYDDEPALLLTKCDKKEGSALLINEEKVVPKLNSKNEGKQIESNVWYLDNGASNHMPGQKSKFKELNEQVTG